MVLPTDHVNHSLGHTMSKSAVIGTLLRAKPSPAVARQLVEWASDTRNRIARGDMVIGILTPEEVSKIPAAYRAAAQGEPNAWLALAWKLRRPTHDPL